MGKFFQLDNVCGVPHNSSSTKILKTEEFNEWLTEQQTTTRLRINARLDLLSLGHFGDHKHFDGLIELKWKSGTRIYAFRWDKVIIVILYGGNKNGQNRDIQKAKKIRAEILNGTHSISK